MLCLAKYDIRTHPVFHKPASLVGTLSFYDKLSKSILEVLTKSVISFAKRFRHKNIIKT